MPAISKAIEGLEALGQKTIDLPSGESVKIAKTPEEKPCLAIRQGRR